MEQRLRKVTCIPAKKSIENSAVERRRKRVAAYCRVSTEEEEQQSSFENQVSYYTNLIQNRPEWTFVGVFADEGISGTQTKKRTAFLELMQLCEEGKVDVILVKSISRFARNTVDTLNYVRKLKEKGIAVIFEKENINTLDVSSEMILTLYSSFAQAESESISQNITWGIRNKFKAGIVRRTCKILGYDVGEDGEWRINKEESQIVRWIYYAYLSGMSYKRIKQMLEEKGVRTARGKEVWSDVGVKYILTNEKYMGDVLLQKSITVDVLSHKNKRNKGELPQYYITDHHEAIIPKEIWYMVKAEMARRNTIKHKDTVNQMKKGHYASQYALTELLICGECGTAYRRVTWTNRGKKKIVWRCVNRLLNGKKYCKHSPTMEEAALQEAIVWAINQKIKDSGELKYYIQESIVYVKQEYIKDSGNNVEKQIKQHEQSISDLTELLDMTTADADYFEKKLQELEQSLRELYQEKNTTQETMQTADHQIDDMLLSWLEQEEYSLKQYHDSLVRKIIKEVRVLQKDRIEVTFQDGETVKALVRL